MVPARPATTGPGLAAVAVAVVACAALVLVALGSVGLAAVLVAPALLLAAAALAGWWVVGRDAEALARGENATREERERLLRDIKRRDAALARERELNARLQRSRRAEREWNQELRSQLQRLQDEHGMLADSQDARAHVLRAAIELVGASKGLLLARTDDDADGDLDLLISHGFDHDPEHSVVAQRFGRQVLERDETVREDEPGEHQTAADREIESLVAIPLYLRDRFAGVVVLANRAGGFEEVDDELLLALGDHAGAALQGGQLRNELRETRRAALRMLTEALAARDPLLQQEAAELAVHTTALARELGLDERNRDVLVCGALLRDLGHLALSGQLLRKLGPLTPEERAVIELHPRIGFTIVSQLPSLREVAVVVLYHHERWDGTGYPAGLAAEGIPFLARALAVLDAYGAMVHERAYRPAVTREEAIERIVAGAGTQFDPEIAQLLVEHLRRAPAEPDAAVSDAIAEAIPLGGGGGQGPALLGELSSPATDGLTLLGNRRALQEAAESAAHAGEAFSVVLLELEDLPRVNEEASYLAGDRLIQVAARHAQRAAVRSGAGAYRVSGRRLALLADGHGSRSPEELLAEVRTEFMAGPTVRLALATSEPGESGFEVVERARAALAASA